MRTRLLGGVLAALPLIAALARPARGDDEPVLLFSIGVHVEPFGATPSPLAGGPLRPPPQAKPPTYWDPRYFQRHVDDIRLLAALAEAHGGRLTVQAQTPFTQIAAERRESLFGELRARGHEVGLHFHEDAHLGRSSEELPAGVWCAVMKEELGYLARAGAPQVAYWSGGNLYPDLLVAASCAGLSVNSDWKNPRTQTTEPALLGVHPWRPAGGPSETDVTRFAAHDPAGPVVFLPEGAYSRPDFASMRRSEELGSDERYFEFLAGELQRSLAAARADRVNVFHFTVHPGEFRGNPNDPYGVIERWLATVLDPLVSKGRVRWATFSKMADAFSAWERANPGVDPRGGPVEPERAGYMTFAVNVHDFLHVDESADAVLALVGIFERAGVKGDFYLTGPMAAIYAKERPDVLSRLEASRMTVSYHLRPPHPAYAGFDGKLEDLSDDELVTALRMYESLELDLVTGEAVPGETGGYTGVAAALARRPVAVSVPNANVRIRDAELRVLRSLGARMCVLYHETGTDLAEPFAYHEGLLVRPSDFSVTRWKAGDSREDAFWWNEISGPRGAVYDPVAYLNGRLAAWTASRPAFVTSLIHESNLFRAGPESWTRIYYEDLARTEPRTPPFDLGAPDPSRPRTAAERAAILTAYERLVTEAAARLAVVTSADVLALAESQAASAR